MEGTSYQTLEAFARHALIFLFQHLEDDKSLECITVRLSKPSAVMVGLGSEVQMSRDLNWFRSLRLTPPQDSLFPLNPGDRTPQTGPTPLYLGNHDISRPDHVRSVSFSNTERPRPGVNVHFSE
jgi:hypothetical protein